MMEILIINQSKARIPRKYIVAWLSFIKKELIKKNILPSKINKSLTIVFIESSEAKKLNQQFRKKNYATDILSFDGLDPDSFGDLVICSDIAKKQCNEHQISFRDELAYIILHGFLHLLGYEHENGGKEAEKMFSIQDKLFSKISELNL